MGAFPSAAAQAQPYDPFAQRAKYQQIQGQQQEQQLRAQQMQENKLDLEAKQRDAADQQTVMQVLGTHNGDLDSALPELASKVTAKTFLGLQKAAVETRKSAAELDNKALENHKLRSDAILGVIGEVSKMPPEAVAQNWPAIAQKINEIDPNIAKHVDLSKPIPPEQLAQYGSLFQTQSTALAKEAAARAQKQQEMTAAGQAETARHNQVEENKPTEVGLAVKASGGDASAEKALKRLDQSKREARPVNQFSTSSTDVQDTIQAIADGQASPVLTNYSFRDRTAIAAGLKRAGYNQAQAESDWKATQKHLATLNGAQQERLRQAITFTSDSTDVIEKLYDEWKQVGSTSGLKLFNRASLATAKQLPGKAGATATALEAQINDLTSELGTVYKGGNSSTDESLKLAASNLKADWNEQTFKKALGLIRTNLRLRKNSITSSQAAGVSADSPYTPDQAQPAGGKEIHYKVVNGQLVAQ